MKRMMLCCMALFCTIFSFSQEKKTRALSREEYALAKSASVADLDNDTYVKINQKYVLDRYEMKKPIFITGDDGLRKRIDIYKFIARDSMQELGVVFFYTNEKGKKFTACLPSAPSSGKLWEQYFEDIHAIDKEEKNFVLKLSYVLSREFSALMGKGGNSGPAEDATYGNEICFPGTEWVLMADGTEKLIQSVVPGDKIVSVDPASGKNIEVEVKEKKIHQPERYAITTLTLVKDVVEETEHKLEIVLREKKISATPNHPVPFGPGGIAIGKLPLGAKFSCWNGRTEAWENYTMVYKEEKAHGSQAVYNIETDAGTTLVLNGVIVLQK